MIALLIAVYIATAVVAWGILNADVRGSLPFVFNKAGEKLMGIEWCRKSRREWLAMTTLVSMLGPLGLAMSVFISGFVYHGMTYRTGPADD